MRNQGILADAGVEQAPKNLAKTGIGRCSNSDPGAQSESSNITQIAEREGFEPSNEVDPRYAISSRARSTAPAPLQLFAAQRHCQKASERPKAAPAGRLPGQR
jgi:hypothetical protein